VRQDVTAIAVVNRYASVVIIRCQGSPHSVIAGAGLGALFRLLVSTFDYSPSRLRAPRFVAVAGDQSGLVLFRCRPVQVCQRLCEGTAPIGPLPITRVPRPLFIPPVALPDLPTNLYR
jgi:hypothetical protein